MCAFAVAILVASSASAQTILAGDSALTTPGGGQSTLDLSNFPIQQVFGASLQGNPVVNLKGESLGTGALEGIDTIVRRTSNINISSGTGTGPLKIMALRLVSEQPVVIGSTSYTLRVFLSEFRSNVQTGSATFTKINADGGSFSSTFYVRPKLVFTSTAGSTVIDCGAVTCGNGSDMAMVASNAAFTLSGISNGFNPAAKGVKLLPAGIGVDGDGDGQAEVTTLASSNLFIGVAPIRPVFPLDPVNKMETFSSMHTITPPVPTGPNPGPGPLNGTFVPTTLIN